MDPQTGQMSTRGSSRSTELQLTGGGDLINLEGSFKDIERRKGLQGADLLLWFTPPQK